MAIASASANLVATEDEEKALASIKSLPLGQNIEKLGKSGELFEQAKTIISIYSKSKDSDLLLEHLSKTFKSDRTTIMPAIGTIKRYKVIKIKLSNVYTFGIYFDEKSKQLLNYVVDITFL